MSAAKHKLKFDRRKVDELRRLVDEVGDIHDYRRLMAVWIRAIADLPAGKIAEMLRMKTQTVRQLQSTCHAEGAQALVGRPGRGGRRSVNMSYDNELKLLDKVTVKVEGLRERAVLLEPIMDLEVVAPEDFVGEVMGELNARRGRVTGMESRGSTQIIHGQVPLATMFGYATTLRSATQGRATFTMQFDHYEPVSASLAEEILGRRQARA